MCAPSQPLRGAREEGAGGRGPLVRPWPFNILKKSYLFCNAHSPYFSFSG